MPSITVKFAIGDNVFTCIEGNITECVVTEINAQTTGAGDVVTNTLDRDGTIYYRTDTVTFDTAAHCADYLEANPV